MARAWLQARDEVVAALVEPPARDGAREQAALRERDAAAAERGEPRVRVAVGLGEFLAPGAKVVVLAESPAAADSVVLRAVIAVLGAQVVERGATPAPYAPESSLLVLVWARGVLEAAGADLPRVQAGAAAGDLFEARAHERALESAAAPVGELLARPRLGDEPPARDTRSEADAALQRWQDAHGHARQIARDWRTPLARVELAQSPGAGADRA